jgi:hypothetical protein
MKHLPTIVSVLVLIWAVASLIRVPWRDLTWAVPAYVMAQCIFALVAWWGLQRTAVTSSGYAMFFTGGFFFVLLVALIATSRFLDVFPVPLAVFVLIGTFTSAMATAAAAYWRLLRIYTDGVPHSLLTTVLQGAILSFCGSATLVTLFAEQKPALRISAITLGAFWFLLGSFFLAYSVGIVRMYTAWSRLNHYVPMMLTIVAFSWMAAQVSGLQRESARQLAQHHATAAQVAP